MGANSIALSTDLKTNAAQVVSAGGSAMNTTISGGNQVISLGGLAVDALIYNAGYQQISAGGIASGTTLYGVGTQIVSAGGSAVNTVVSSGGIENVLSGGLASGADVLFGGRINVSSGGVANGTDVLSGGREHVTLGGIASATTIQTGGSSTVSSGGTARGTTLAGGTLDIQAGGTASSTITFDEAGTLQIADSDTFTATIAGLTDTDELINLLDIDFASATLGYSGDATSGVLTISDGVDTAQLNLIGQYTAASFHMASNGAGGTLVWDPPIVPDQNTLSIPH